MRILSVLAMLSVVVTRAQVPEISLVSKPISTGAHSVGDTLGVELSATGEWAALTTTADALVPEIPRGPQDLQVYLRNTRTGSMTLVSRGANNLPAAGSSIATGISADGRFVVFESDAPDLVPNDDNESNDIFLYDRDSASISLISRTESGLANAGSTGALITPNGRYILFESEGSNLTANDGNDASDLFRFDREQGTLELVTANLNNTGPSDRNAADFAPTISNDGNLVAFLTTATNVASGFLAQTNAQLVLRDLRTDSSLWISQKTDGTPQNSVSAPLLSADGSTLASLVIEEIAEHFITSSVSGRVTRNVDTRTFISLYSVVPQVAEEIPFPDDLRDGSPDSFALNEDGSSVVHSLYGSLGTNSISAPQRRLYLYDKPTRTNHHILSHAVSFRSPGEFRELRISSDGGVLTFLADVDTVEPQLYSFIHGNGPVRLLSRNAQGIPADDTIASPALSSDGSTVAFTTLARNLGPGDQFGYGAYLVSTSGEQPALDLAPPHPMHFSVSANGSSELYEAVPLYGTMPYSFLSLDGRFVVFRSDASNLVPGDTNGVADIFIHDLNTGETLSPYLRSREKTFYLGGFSADGSLLAYALQTGGAFAFYLYDVHTRSNTLVQESTPIGFRAFGISEDGRYHISGTNVYERVLDLTTGDTLITGRYDTERISSGGQFLSRLQELYRWSDGTILQLPGFPIDSSLDDSVFLLGNFKRTFDAPPLSVYFPATAEYHTIAANVSLPSMSGDGSTVVYGQNGQTFIYDVASQSSSELRSPEGRSFELNGRPNLSPDGRFIAFASRPSPDEYSEAYLYDRALTNLVLINRATNGTSSALPAGTPFVSANGRVIVFDSPSSDLVPNDHNQHSDVFVARLPMRDSDNDGLEDGWEYQRYGTLAINADSDPDGDGVRAGDDFLHGSAGKPALSFARQENAHLLRFNAVPWRTYQLQRCTDLSAGAWADDGHPISAFGTQVELRVTPAATQGFYRLRLQQ